LVVRRLWSDGRLQRPDLLHVVHEEMVKVALALAETSQLPYVQTVAGFGAVERGLKLSRRWCRRLVATSPDLVQELVGELGVPMEWIALIPPGILTQNDRSQKVGASSVPVIGAGGPREERSGLFVFLDAARLVIGAGYDVEFVIASHGSEQAALRHRALSLELAERVTVTDYPIALPELWSVLDVYCQPSVSASTGRTLMQAQARAVPCIATNVKGLRALIDSGETGLVVPPADPVALHKAMIALLDHPEEAHRLGRNAFDRARSRFDVDVEADRLADLYRQVVR
jgi:glycosyltransferase involved in cell wall biosynthesis